MMRAAAPRGEDAPSRAPGQGTRARGPESAWAREGEPREANPAGAVCSSMCSGRAVLVPVAAPRGTVARTPRRCSHASVRGQYELRRPVPSKLHGTLPSKGLALLRLDRLVVHQH